MQRLKLALLLFIAYLTLLLAACVVTADDPLSPERAGRVVDAATGTARTIATQNRQPKQTR
jgi:uncharacterized membrane protein YgcG